MSYKTFLIKISHFFDQIGLRHWERKLKDGLFKMLGRIFGARLVSKIDDARIQNILIIRQHNQMGDMLCSTPLFTAVRQRFPRAYITLIASEVNFPVVQYHPAIDRVLLFEKQNFLARPGDFIRFWRSLRERKYDLGIVPSTVSMSVTSDLLCLVARTRYRLGVRTLNGEANPSAFIYNLPVDLDWRNNHLHQTERNLVILKAIGWTEPAGALSIVCSTAFPPVFDYVALGHMHVPQRVDKTEHMRYCGSPIPMGFGEAKQQKLVLLVDFEGREPNVTEIEIPRFQPLERLAGSLDELSAAIAALRSKGSNAWLEIDYRGDEAPAIVQEAMEGAVAGSLLEIRRIRNNRPIQQALRQSGADETLQDLDPEAVFNRCLEAYGTDESLRPALVESYREVLRSIREDDVMAEKEVHP